MDNRPGLMIILVLAFFLFYVPGYSATTNQSINLTNGKDKPNEIFSFNEAAPSADYKNGNSSRVWFFDNNLSVEERYNRMGREMTDAEVHTSIDGEQIICYQCIPIPVN